MEENDPLKLKVGVLSRNAVEAMLKENLSLKEELDAYTVLLLPKKYPVCGLRRGVRGDSRE